MPACLGRGCGALSCFALLDVLAVLDTFFVPLIHLYNKPLPESNCFMLILRKDTLIIGGYLPLNDFSVTLRIHCISMSVYLHEAQDSAEFL